jgi:hypothetical protein
MSYICSIVWIAVNKQLREFICANNERFIPSSNTRSSNKEYMFMNFMILYRITRVFGIKLCFCVLCKELRRKWHQVCGSNWLIVYKIIHLYTTWRTLLYRLWLWRQYSGGIKIVLICLHYYVSIVMVLHLFRTDYFESLGSFSVSIIINYILTIFHYMTTIIRCIPYFSIWKLQIIICSLRIYI